MTGNKNVQMAGVEENLQSVRFFVYEQPFENIGRKQKGLKAEAFNLFYTSWKSDLNRRPLHYE